MRWTSEESLVRHEDEPERVQDSRQPVFVFSGLGSHWAGMGRALLERSPVCAAVLEACEVQVRRHLGWSLLEALTAEDERLATIEVTCPAIVSMEIALAAQWRAWGVEPAAVVGHSIGEVAAAHVAGVLSLEDAMRVICHLGRGLGKLRGKGAMAVVGLPWERAGEALPEYAGRLWRAIHASPDWTVLAAEPEVLEPALVALRRQGVPARRVASEVAAHCPLVEPIREELRGHFQGIRPERARLPIVSTVTGGELEGERFDAGYWVRNVADPVLFHDAVEVLLGRGHGLFLEISPHPVVKHSLESCLERTGRQGTSLVSMRRGKDPESEMRGTLRLLSGRPESQEVLLANVA